MDQKVNPYKNRTVYGLQEINAGVGLYMPEM